LSVAFGPAFDPTFATTDNNYYVYVYYTTVDTSVHNRASHFPATEDSNGKVVAGIDNEEIIFELPPVLGAEPQRWGHTLRHRR